MTARALEALLLNVAARAVAPMAHDQREANVFQLAAVLVRSGFPNESNRLLLASEQYFATHRCERLATGDVVRKGWVRSVNKIARHVEAELAAVFRLGAMPNRPVI